MANPPAGGVLSGDSVLDALIVKIRDGAHVTNRAAHIAVGVDMDGIRHVLGIWVPSQRGCEVLGRDVCRAGQPWRADRVLRRPHRLSRGDRGYLEPSDGPNLCGPS